MIKRRRYPRRCVVANLALLSDSRLDVIRRCRSIEILDVAAVAIGWRVRELAVDVAQTARDRGVRARQRETALAVIKRCRYPRRCRMASLALLRETTLHVVRIGRSGEILHVTAVAIGGRPLESSANVAGRALERRVRARQNKAREFQVIELGIKPRVGAVARLAGRGEVESFVIRVDRFLKVGGVAGEAGGR